MIGFEWKGLWVNLNLNRAQIIMKTGNVNARDGRQEPGVLAVWKIWMDKEQLFKVDKSATNL